MLPTVLERDAIGISSHDIVDNFHDETGQRHPVPFGLLLSLYQHVSGGKIEVDRPLLDRFRLTGIGPSGGPRHETL